MANSAYNSITGATGAGRAARRLLAARLSGEGIALPILQRLRS